MTPSPVAPKYVWTTIVEEELSFQLFSNDSSILNSKQSLSVIAQEYEEEEEWINDYDKAHGSMGMVMYIDMCYLI